MGPVNVTEHRAQQCVGVYLLIKIVDQYFNIVSLTNVVFHGVCF